MLSHSRVCTVGTDENVAMMGAVVGASNFHAFFILLERQHPLAQIDTIAGNMAPEQVVEIWSGDDVLAVV